MSWLQKAFISIFSAVMSNSATMRLGAHTLTINGDGKRLGVTGLFVDGIQVIHGSKVITISSLASQILPPSAAATVTPITPLSRAA